MVIADYNAGDWQWWRTYQVKYVSIRDLFSSAVKNENALSLHLPFRERQPQFPAE